MRIKKDPESWHASGVKVRDARHDKSFDGPTKGGKRKKKNGRKWCRGIEGRLHTLEWVDVAGRHYPCKNAVCKECNISIENRGNWDQYRKDPNEVFTPENYKKVWR